MLRRLDLRSVPLPGAARLRGLLPRAEVNVDAVVDQVRPIVDAVRERGTEAVPEFSERFDRVRPTGIRVPVQTLSGALAALDPAVRAALETAIERARTVHADQRRVDVTTQVVPGGTVTERFVPVRRVGLYAPGGLAVYPSSVVMNVVPAQEAGVESLVLVSRRKPSTAASRTHGPRPPPRCWASTRCGPRAVPRRSRCSRTAAPTPTGPNWSRSTWSPAPATSTSPPPSACSAG